MTIYDLFVPTFAPRYQEMIERGGRPGVSLEESTRGGVWVPRDWYQPERGPDVTNQRSR
jgi:hypothetical protein